MPILKNDDLTELTTYLVSYLDGLTLTINPDGRPGRKQEIKVSCHYSTEKKRLIYSPEETKNKAFYQKWKEAGFDIYDLVDIISEEKEKKLLIAAQTLLSYMQTATIDSNLMINNIRELKETLPTDFKPKGRQVLLSLLNQLEQKIQPSMLPSVAPSIQPSMGAKPPSQRSGSLLSWIQECEDRLYQPAAPTQSKQDLSLRATPPAKTSASVQIESTPLAGLPQAENSAQDNLIKKAKTELKSAFQLFDNPWDNRHLLKTITADEIIAILVKHKNTALVEAAFQVSARNACDNVIELLRRRFFVNIVAKKLQPQHFQILSQTFSSEKDRAFLQEILLKRGVEVREAAKSYFFTPSGNTPRATGKSSTQELKRS